MANRLDVVRRMLEAGGQAPARVADFIQTAGGDAAMAARLTEAADTGDYRAILREMSEQQWGRTPAVPAPAAPAPAGSRSPMPFEQRVARDPEIRKTIEAAGIPPALRAGVDAGDPEAIMAAYRGAGRAEDSIRTLRKPPDQVAAEGIASQFDRALGGDATASHMESILDAAQRQTAAAQLFSPQAGLRTVDGEPAFNVWMRQNMGAGAAEDAGPYRFVDRAAPRPSLRSRAAFHAKNAVAGVDGRKAATAAAAAAGLGGAAYLASQSGKDLADAAVESGGEADLAAETSPPPAVEATADVPEPQTARAPADYSFRARFLINRLNDMRRAASPEVLRANGGDVPGAATIKAEIDRLLALGNEQRRNTATFVPADEGSRLYKQAQVLIDQVNQLQSQGVPHGSPQVQRLMAQVRQLQAQGDAIRNRRAG